MTAPALFQYAFFKFAQISVLQLILDEDRHNIKRGLSERVLIVLQNTFTAATPDNHTSNLSASSARLSHSSSVPLYKFHSFFWMKVGLSNILVQGGGDPTLGCSSPPPPIIPSYLKPEINMACLHMSDGNVLVWGHNSMM